LEVSGANPGIALNDTAVAANGRLWDFFASGGQLRGRALNDALSGANDWIEVNRTAGTWTITTVVLPPAGSVGINTGAVAVGAPLHVRSYSGAGGVGILFQNGPNGADSTSQMILFQDYASTVNVGAITRTGTNAVLYGTTSDERLKDAITESKRGLDALMAIKVSDYTMGETASQGLLAQDVAKVYPEAVHEGGKDPNLEPWMIDYGRLSPLLIKGIQQQQEMIAALQAKVAALESGAAGTLMRAT
jgi:hypothetical protein